jgi:ribosome-binding factor A
MPASEIKRSAMRSRKLFVPLHKPRTPLGLRFPEPPRPLGSRSQVPLSQNRLSMETPRQNKIARLIQKDLSTIFQEETRKTHGILISVSVVRVSPDLSIAKAYLSIFPSARAQELLDNINAQASAIRYKLGTLERHQLRIIPELKFFIDDSLDYIENIDHLLKQ